MDRTTMINNHNPHKSSLELSKVNQLAIVYMASEERSRALAKAVNSALFVADIETGIVIDVNKQAEQMIGLSAEEIIGKHQTFLYPAEESGHYKRLFRKHIDDETAVLEPAIVCDKDGRRIPVDVCVNVISLNCGRVIKSFLRETVADKRVEGNFEATNKYLEQRVVQRTDELLEVNKILQNELAERKKVENMLYVNQEVLEAKNAALTEILDHLEIEKKKIKENITANVQNHILPILQKLRKKEKSHHYIDLLQKALQDLTSSYGTNQIKNEAKLTPREIEICDMIKSGISGKEIAEILDISHGTIERHRNNIRRKLGIKNRKISLSFFLKTL
ncbi:MAG: PAS domain S-box protein [Candidatus Brocadiaceae bacterium]|nr:PAS domain S-box protein [Candidatus Brocadiaceae bacterium]